MPIDVDERNQREALSVSCRSVARDRYGRRPPRRLPGYSLHEPASSLTTTTMDTCCEPAPALELEPDPQFGPEPKPENQTRRENALLRKQQLQVEDLQNQIRELHSGFVCCLNQL